MNKYILLSATALVAVLSFNAKAADSATGTAQVEVVQAIDINHADADSLNFGSVYAKDGNTVVITQGGARDSGKGFGNTSADKFTISGPNGGSCTVTIPSTATMNKSGGGSLTATLNPSTASGSTINLTGTDVVINIGGSVTVSSSTATGSYSGTYTVSIAY